MTSEPVYRPHPEPVVLEIGGTIGALIVHGRADQIDVPVEISPTGDDAARSHQHILERPMPGHTAYAAVFDRIEQGSYTLWMHNEARARDVTIEGGSVTELDWRAKLDDAAAAASPGDQSDRPRILRCPSPLPRTRTDRRQLRRS